MAVGSAETPGIVPQLNMDAANANTATPGAGGETPSGAPKRAYQSVADRLYEHKQASPPPTPQNNIKPKVFVEGTRATAAGAPQGAIIPRDNMFGGNVAKQTVKDAKAYGDDRTKPHGYEVNFTSDGKKKVPGSERINAFKPNHANPFAQYGFDPAARASYVKDDFVAGGQVYRIPRDSQSGGPTDPLPHSPKKARINTGIKKKTDLSHMRSDATRAGARSTVQTHMPTAKNPHAFYFTGNAAVKKSNHMHDRDHVGTLMRDDAISQPDQNDGKLASVLRDGDEAAAYDYANGTFAGKTTAQLDEKRFMGNSRKAMNKAEIEGKQAKRGLGHGPLRWTAEGDIDFRVKETSKKRISSNVFTESMFKDEGHADVDSAGRFKRLGGGVKGGKRQSSAMLEYVETASGGDLNQRFGARTQQLTSQKVKDIIHESPAQVNVGVVKTSNGLAPGEVSIGKKEIRHKKFGVPISQSADNVQTVSDFERKVAGARDNARGAKEMAALFRARDLSSMNVFPQQNQEFVTQK